MRFLVLSLVFPVLLGADITKLATYISKSNESEVESKAIFKNIILESFPYLESACAQHALSLILPQCLKHGIETVSTEIRTFTAIQLSICELKASKITNVPKKCNNISNMDKCLKLIENSSQWWTTYSGYYQRIPSICFENALPYEKEQILELFLNITNMYHEFGDEFKAQLENYREDLDYITTDGLQYLKTKINQTAENITKGLDNELENIQKRVEITIETLELNSRDIRDIFNDISNELRDQEAANQIAVFKEQILKGWKDINTKFNEYKNYHTGYMHDVDLVFQEFYLSTTENIVKAKDAIIDTQMDTIEVLKEFNNVVASSVIPVISEKLIPNIEELSETIYDKLSLIDYVVEERIELLNNCLLNAFEIMDSRINSTMERVDEMEQSIMSLHSKFENLIIFGTNILYSFLSIYRFSKKLVCNYNMIMVLIAPLLFYKKISFHQPLIFLILKSIILFSSVLIGAKTGFILSGQTTQRPTLPE